MKTFSKISFKSMFIIFLSMMISNVSFSSDFFKEGKDFFQIEIEEEEEKDFFHSNSFEYQQNVFSDGGNDFSNEMNFVEEIPFIFPVVIKDCFSFDEFSSDSFHVPLYIKYCSIKAYIG